MSSKPLVPSKDALRTLRNLANAPSTVIIGTASALCGVATIHYHERRKVCLAERILETKRKIHSISNGRGSATLALMFEAAERGEDFTMNRNKRPRPARRKKLSTLATEHQSEEDSNWRPFANDSDTPRPAQKTPIALIGRVQDPVKPPSIIDDILNKYNEDADDSQRKGSAWDQVMAAVTQSIAKDKESIRFARQDHVWKSFSEYKAPTTQNLSDLSPIKGDIPSAIVGSRNEIQAEDSDANPISLKLDNPNTFELGSFNILQPWTQKSDKEQSKNDSTTPQLGEDDHLKGLDLYLNTSAEVPLDLSNRLFHTDPQYISRYDTQHKRVKQGLFFIGIRRYFYVYNSIVKVFKEYGREDALILLERTMCQYTTTDRQPDFALAQALFLDFTRLFTAEELNSLAWRYVEKFLRGDLPKLEVVSFLYPRCGAVYASKKQYFYYLAHKYLETLGHKGYNLDRQVTHLRKVLAGTKLCNIELHEHLIVPVLRSLSAAGRMTAAQALLNEMTTVHKIEATFYCVQILIKGYAKVGNWSKVKKILDSYYDDGAFVNKAYGVSHLLVSVIGEYSLVKSPDSVVRFVMHSIKQYKLLPISSMTREIVTICLRHRRYDLIVNWLTMIQRDYPHIDTGTGSSTFAFDVTCVWRDINASCEDILHGCRAIATETIHDPFSNVFRASIREAVTRFVNKQLKELRQHLGDAVPETARGSIKEFHRSMKDLKENAATKVEGSRARLLLSGLLHQVEALRWLNALTRGHVESAGTSPVRSVRFDSDDLRRVKNHDLPRLEDVQEIIFKTYAQRDNAGQPIDHSNLQDTAAKLTKKDRLLDAFELIRAVYNSKWAQIPTGREFDIDLFTDWLQLASDLRSGSKVRSILWAVVEATPQLKIDSRIILLARIAAPKISLQKNKQARVSEVEEVEYLRLRLRRRHWTTNQGERNLTFDDWKAHGDR